MTRWEYKHSGVDNLIDLNKLGEEGWDLVNVHDAYAPAYGSASYRRGLFKRPKQLSKCKRDACEREAYSLDKPHCVYHMCVRAGCLAQRADFYGFCEEHWQR